MKKIKFVWTDKDVVVIIPVLIPNKNETLEDFVDRGKYHESVNMFIEEVQVMILKDIYIKEMGDG